LKVYFWGTGSFAANYVKSSSFLFESIQEKAFIKREHIPETIEYFYNINVISPSELRNTHFDYICILSSFEQEIKYELIKTYNISEDIIVSTKQLAGIIIEQHYLHFQYEHRPLFNKEFMKRIMLSSLTQNDKNANKMLNDYCDYQYLKRRYYNFAHCQKNQRNHSLNEVGGKETNRFHTFIWTCWLQGYDSAPDIVKACISSMKHYVPDAEINIITEDNLSKYVTFPDFILDKYHRGIISKTHFSDLLRLELLINYGGVWMDSTVLLTQKIPDYIFNSQLFVFDISKRKTLEPRLASNWFIASKPYNKILYLTRTLLYKYYEENDYILNYYMFHYFFRISTEVYNEDWQNLYHMTGDTSILANILFEFFDEERYEFIKQVCFCQKLTYKFANQKLGVHKNINNTFYEKIIKENSM
jgi:hypothetical protein